VIVPINTGLNATDCGSSGCTGLTKKPFQSRPCLFLILSSAFTPKVDGGGSFYDRIVANKGGAVYLGSFQDSVHLPIPIFIP
jgi:hypothetical protein